MLVLIKFLAVAGLGVGIVAPGHAFASNFGAIAIFLAATAAHLRARFHKQEFWLNCLGMLVSSLAVFLVSYWSQWVVPQALNRDWLDRGRVPSA